MDSEKPHTCCKFIPEIGRGCAFCNAGDEAEARSCDGCFKLHETPWLEEYPQNIPTDIFEVRFKNTRRSFYQNVNNLPLKRGDIVAVEASPGHDIGIISLTGDLVAKQMRRTGFNPYNGEYKKIYRKAKPYDIERWQEAIALEHETMIAARQIAADMGLNMKIGDVEYQGDKIKAIFYYIADERVDFRELIKVFAERFHIRIEMKQIGARQEAGRIGGLGACGRELCCASWMSSFSSVTTGAARVQDISLNPQKLAGQCSKLKCCLMYEYDTYADARKEFPRLREPLQTSEGEWFFVKNDLLAGTMSFSSSKETLANITAVPVARVKEILAQNRAGKKPEQLLETGTVVAAPEEPTYRAEEDSITRFDSTKRRGRRNRNRGGKGPDSPRSAEAGAPRNPSASEENEKPAGRAQRNRKTQEQPGSPKEAETRTENRRPPRDNGTDTERTERTERSERPENGSRRNGRNRERNNRSNGPQRESSEAGPRNDDRREGESPTGGDSGRRDRNGRQERGQNAGPRRRRENNNNPRNGGERRENAENRRSPGDNKSE